MHVTHSHFSTSCRPGAGEDPLYEQVYHYRDAGPPGSHLFMLLVFAGVILFFKFRQSRTALLQAMYMTKNLVPRGQKKRTV
jgi:hypothetical protein